MNINIAHGMNLWSFKQSADLLLGNSLFWVLKLTKDGGFEKYVYSSYDLKFDARGSISFSDSNRFGWNIIFVVDVSQQKDISILGIGTN